MKILVVTPYIPYPLNSGGNQAISNMLDRLSHEHEVSLLLIAKHKDEIENCKKVQELLPLVKVITYSSSYTHKRSVLSCCNKNDRIVKVLHSFSHTLLRKANKRIIKGMKKQSFTSKNAGMMVRASSSVFSSDIDLKPDYIQTVNDEIQNGKYDMVQVEFYELIQLAYALPKNVRKVFVHHELRFIRNENEMELFDTCPLMAKIEIEKAKANELHALSLFDDVIVLTETDKQILKKYLPTTHIYVSPAVTKANLDNQDSVTFTPSSDVVFIGSGSHFPNADGLWWFAQHVSPYLFDRGFKGKIYVTGSWNSKLKANITSFCKNIEFVGFVDDLVSFLNGKISIVPIRIGSGMRMKIMDASASMSPLVTTTKGCEGLPLNNNEDCFITDSPEVFAESILKLCNDVELQQSFSENLSSKIRSLMNGEELLQRRMDFYNNAE